MRKVKNMSERTELFLNEYKRMEAFASSKFNLQDTESAVYHLINLPEYRYIRTELEYCRKVRNVLQHNPKIRDSFAVEPSAEMIELLRKTIEIILNPPKAREIAIPKTKILYKTLDDYVRPTMTEMIERTFTHIPILENGIVTGVFSENTVLSYLADEQIIGVDDTTRFFDLKAYLPIDVHKSESFRFIPQDMPLAEVSLIFEDALKKQDRIGLVFITQTGKSTEKVLGIITAWDVAGANA